MWVSVSLLFFVFGLEWNYIVAYHHVYNIFSWRSEKILLELESNGILYIIYHVSLNLTYFISEIFSVYESSVIYCSHHLYLFIKCWF